MTTAGDGLVLQAEYIFDAYDHASKSASCAFLQAGINDLGPAECVCLINLQKSMEVGMGLYILKVTLY